MNGIQPTSYIDHRKHLTANSTSLDKLRFSRHTSFVLQDPSQKILAIYHKSSPHASLQRFSTEEQLNNHLAQTHGSFTLKTKDKTRHFALHKPWLTAPYALEITNNKHSFEKASNLIGALKVAAIALLTLSKNTIIPLTAFTGIACPFLIQGAKAMDLSMSFEVSTSVFGAGGNLGTSTSTQLMNSDVVFAWVDNQHVMKRAVDLQGVEVNSQKQITVQFPNSEPKLVSLADGGYLLAWNDLSSSNFSIRLQRYNSNHSEIGSIFNLLSPISGSQVRASLAKLINDKIIVVWADNQVVVQQLLDIDLTPEWATEQTVYSESLGPSSRPEVLPLDNGGWVDFFQVGNLNEGDILQQKYYSNGTEDGPPRNVHTIIAGQQAHPKAALVDGLGYVVCWATINTTNSQILRYDYRRFDIFTNPIDQTDQPIESTGLSGSWQSRWDISQDNLQAFDEKNTGFGFLFRGAGSNKISRQKFFYNGTLDANGLAVFPGSARDVSTTFLSDGWVESFVNWGNGPTGIYTNYNRIAPTSAPSLEPTGPPSNEPTLLPSNVPSPEPTPIPNQNPIPTTFFSTIPGSTQEVSQTHPSNLNSSQDTITKTSLPPSQSPTAGSIPEGNLSDSSSDTTTSTIIVTALATFFTIAGVLVFLKRRNKGRKQVISEISLEEVSTGRKDSQHYTSVDAVMKNSAQNRNQYDQPTSKLKNGDTYQILTPKTPENASQYDQVPLRKDINYEILPPSKVKYEALP